MNTDAIRNLNSAALAHCSAAGLESFSIEWWPEFTRYVLEHAPAREAPPPATIAELIALLQEIRPEFGAVGSRDVDVRAQRDRIDAAIPALAALATPFQARVQPWLMACFGAMIAGDREERNHRFFEEAGELVQSLGMSAHEAHQLVDYVWNRPVGEPNQEVGGTMVTLAALCLANALDMHAAGETELARVWTKVEQIRAKQAAKPKHSPLPEHVAANPGAGYWYDRARDEGEAPNPSDKQEPIGYASRRHLDGMDEKHPALVYPKSEDEWTVPVYAAPLAQSTEKELANASDKQPPRRFTDDQIAALRVAADSLIERYAAPIRAILSDAEHA
jgi:hypothetical protein